MLISLVKLFCPEKYRFRRTSYKWVFISKASNEDVSLALPCNMSQISALIKSQKTGEQMAEQTECSELRAVLILS